MSLVVCVLGWVNKPFPWGTLVPMWLSRFMKIIGSRNPTPKPDWTRRSFRNPSPALSHRLSPSGFCPAVILYACREQRPRYSWHGIFAKPRYIPMACPCASADSSSAHPTLCLFTLRTSNNKTERLSRWRPHQVNNDLDSHWTLSYFAMLSLLSSSSSPCATKGEEDL